MAKMEGNQQRVLATVQKEKVQFIQMQFTDILGVQKCVSIPSAKLEDAFEDDVNFDGSSIAGYCTIEESDMRARPLPQTFEILPWTGGSMKTARLICDVYTPDGKRFEGDPRFVLERVVAKAQKKGWTPMVGPEYEFFLFQASQVNGSTPIPGHSDQGGYFDLMPQDEGDIVRKEVVAYLNGLGYDIEASHHEVAPSQHEIDLRYSDALTMADRVFGLKYTIRNIAMAHGMHATFMPKPIAGINGSGMHVHQSLTSKDGTNTFFDPKGKFQLSQQCLYYIGGILANAQHNCAILASWVNSYKRLIPGFEAPVYVSWANKNRSALVRIPSSRGRGTRIEVRNPDPSGNIYLQLAVLIGSGLDGIERKLAPGDPTEVDIYQLNAEDRRKRGIDSLPDNLGHSLNVLRQSKLMQDILGPHVFNNFMRVKTDEWDSYRSTVHPWELHSYLRTL